MQYQIKKLFDDQQNSNDTSKESFQFEEETSIGKMINIIANNSKNMKDNISSVKKDINLIISSLDQVTDSLITLKSGFHSMMQNFTKTENDLECFSEKLDLLHLELITKEENMEKKDNKDDDIKKDINNDTNNICSLIQQNQNLYMNMSLLLAEKEVDRLMMINIKKRLTELESKLCLDQSFKNTKSANIEDQSEANDLNEAFIKSNVKNSQKLTNLKQKYLESVQEANDDASSQI